MQAAEEGRLREIFGCGTAVIIQPVEGLIRGNGEVIASPWDPADPATMTILITMALTEI